MLAVGVSLCGTPRLSVSFNGGAVGVRVAPELEGEDTSRARIIATDGDTATTVNVFNGLLFYYCVYMINIYNTHLIEVGCPTQQVIKTKKWKLEYMSIAYRD